jgi:hypothetical protein
VRKVSAVLLAALAMQLSLIPVASALDTSPSPSPTESSPTTSPSPTGTPSPTESSPTGTPPPTGPTFGGTFTRAPSSGPAGTVITVKSITACVVAPGGAPGAHVVVFFFQPLALMPSNTSVDLPVGAGGAWSGSVKVPAGAKPDAYRLDAECFATATDQNPVIVYDMQDFDVTATPTSPVAAPVAGSPSFTG